MLLNLTIETIETDGKYISFSIVNIYRCNPHMYKMGPRRSKHYIFGDHFYSKNARNLRFYVFLHFNAMDHMVLLFYLKWTKFTRNWEFVPI